MGNPPVVVALLLVRVVVGITMIMHGYNHWRGGGRIAGTARWFSGLGLRYGVLQAWMSVVTELGAGLLLIAGLLTPLACAAVISVMLIAGLLAHRPNGFFVFKDGYEYVLVLSVISLALAATGPGRFSLDNAVGSEITGWAGGGIALGVAVVATTGMLATFWRSAPQKTPTAEEPSGSQKLETSRLGGRPFAPLARLAFGSTRSPSEELLTVDCPSGTHLTAVLPGREKRT
jgi:putative oxidoreductase